MNPITIKPVASFLLGITSIIILPKIIRPLLVGTVSAGIASKEYAKSAWASGVSEAKKIRQEATPGYAQKSLEDEINSLRAELAELKK